MPTTSYQQARHSVHAQFSSSRILVPKLAPKLTPKLDPKLDPKLADASLRVLPSLAKDSLPSPRSPPPMLRSPPPMLRRPLLRPQPSPTPMQPSPTPMQPSPTLSPRASQRPSATALGGRCFLEFRWLLLLLLLPVLLRLVLLPSELAGMLNALGEVRAGRGLHVGRSTPFGS